MKTKKFLALVLALVMAFSLVVPASANVYEAIPEPDTLDHDGTKLHDTAKMTVYVTTNDEQTSADKRTSVAAVGAINSHMDATLELNYGKYPIDGTITAYGQTENKANKAEFTLNGTSNTSIDFSNESTYFPGLSGLEANTPYYIKFVDAMGTTDDGPIGVYTLKKTYTAGEKGITLTATNTAADNEVKDVDKSWQALKREAFVEDSYDDGGDSYISLAAGSYIALNTEKLIAAGTLKLDNFSDSDSVEANIKNAKKQLMLATGTGLGYQILLKKGTRFKLGNSYADVGTDLLITMEGNAAFNTGTTEDSNLLSNIYTNLTSSGKATLAENMLHLFSYIAGSVKGTEGNPVVITFGTPTSSSSKTGDTTVETTVTKNEAGTNDVTTVETTTSTENNVETKTVTTTSSTVTLTSAPTDTSTQTYSVKSDSQKVTTTTTTEGNVVTSQNVEAVSLGTKENTVTLNAEEAANNPNLSTANTSANIVDAKLDQLTDAAKATIVTEAVAQAQGSGNNVTVTLAIVAEALNDDGETTKKYEVKPVVTTQVGNGQPTTATVSNDSLKGSFEIKLPVPAAIAAPGNQVKVTHRSTGYEDEESTKTVDEDGTVTITVTHFSEFVLEPISAGSSSELRGFKSLSLTDEIAVNFYIRDLHGDVSNDEAYEGYTVEYYTTVNGQKGESVTTPFAQLDVKQGSDSNNYRYVKLAKFAARQMTDTVTVIVWNGNSQEFTATYSIQGYCNEVISGNYLEELKNVCRAILDYGKYSQLYFNYKTNTLANSANGGNDYLTLRDVPVAFACTNNGSDGVIASLSLKSQVIMNIYVPETTQGSIIEISVPKAETNISEDVQTNLAYTNKGSVTSNKGDKYTHIEVTGYVARTLGDTVTVTVEGHSYTWSPLSYSYAVQNNSNVKLANVSRAVYNYYFYAVEYFNYINSVNS